MPSATALLAAFPNPFNPSVTIPFNLLTAERVTLRIYDTRGALVRTLRDEILPAGLHHAFWDGRDVSSRPVATGIYFVRFVAGDYQSTRKIVLLK